MKLSCHDYQLSMSLGIKYLWNYEMKLFFESECFIQILFYFIWHGSLETTPRNSDIGHARTGASGVTSRVRWPTGRGPIDFTFTGLSTVQVQWTSGPGRH